MAERASVKKISQLHGEIGAAPERAETVPSYISDSLGAHALDEFGGFTMLGEAESRYGYVVKD